MLCSHDFEDIVCLFDGRPEIVDEIAESPDELRRELATRLAQCVANPDFESAIDGFVQTEPAAESRKAELLRRFRSVAGLSGEAQKRLCRH